MNKHLQTLLALLLSLCLLAGCALPAFATEEAPAPLQITSAEEFLQFAEACRLDAYSQGLTVELQNDLNLSGTGFAGVPIFCGSFNGNGYSITGLSLTTEGSAQGLFRYVAKGAVIENLSVYGTVSPEGSRNMTGGIAGSNSGTIRNCGFDGLISGGRQVGGIAGTNTVSGCIEDCRVHGILSGDHFAGGIAGENLGTIRRCVSYAKVNVTEDENQVDVADISLHTITGTEASHTVTDIGGIAGTSSGVVRSCENHGPVGYPHMGYNIGGIAGSHSGLIADSVNHGEIHGRKEVGGIVGQCEPVQNISYHKDTLQILQQQVRQTSNLADQTSASLKNNAATMQEQVQAMQGHAENASDAINQLLPDRESGLPDDDAVQAAKNSLSSSVSAMNGVVDSMTSSAKENAETISGQVHALAAQMDAIGKTIGSAENHLGGEVNDISDLDTAEDLSSKVTDCKNLGEIEGDLNVGGIAGSIAWENDWDPEDDLTFSGNRSLNFKGEMRSVVCSSENSAQISAKKRQVGGIVGLAACGLVRDCINTGNLSAESAKQAGGIVGSSSGYLRSCYAKCILTAKSSIGGIAGNAAIATDCRSVVQITDGTEKLGAILGEQTEPKQEIENPISGNLYVVTQQDWGGIDGISYNGLAQSKPLESFLQLEDLPDSFHTAQLTFQQEDGIFETLTLPLGGALDEQDIPAVSAQDKAIGQWDGLEEIDPEHIYFDYFFPAVYTTNRTTLRSEEARADGSAILLVEGAFGHSDNFTLTELDTQPAPDSGETLLEGWQIPSFGEDALTRLRIACPDNQDIDLVRVKMLDSAGNWRTAEIQKDGQYLLVPVQPEDTGFYLVSAAAQPVWLWYVAGSIVLILLLILVLRKKKHRSRSKQKPAQKPAAV